ncbi:hypothetical protein ACWGH4_08825 [Streptomyces sp. NPDC054847]
MHACAVVAQRQLEHGHLDAACESWTRFFGEHEHVSPARGYDHFATTRRRLAPHAKAQVVRETAPRLREIAALKA